MTRDLNSRTANLAFGGKVRLYGSVAVLVAAVSAMPATASAQSESAESAEASSQDSANAAEIIVTATRRAQSLKNVPASVQAVAAIALNQRVAVDTVSLVQISPSVNFQTGFSSNSGGFIIRGVSSQAAEGGFQQSTAMVIDGVAVARPGEYLGDLGDIERVEVLRGPQGTLFGKNATAGLINIVTKRPTDKFEGYVQAGITNDEEYSGRAMLNVPLGANVSARVSGFYKHLKPLIKNLGPAPDVAGYEQYGIQGKLLARLSDKTDLLLSAEYRNADSTFGQLINIVPSTSPFVGGLQIATLGFTPTYGDPKVRTNGTAFDSSTGYALTANLTSELTDNLTLYSITAFRHYKNDSVLDTDNTQVGCQQGVGCAPNPLGYPVQHFTSNAPRYPQVTDYWSQEVRLNYKTSNIDLILGAFYQGLKEKGQNTVPFIFDGAYVLRNPAFRNVLFYNDAAVNYRITDNTASIFGDITFKLNNQFSVFGGLRYTHEKIKDDFTKKSYFGAIGQLVNGVNVFSPAFNPVTGATTLVPTTTAFVDEATTNNLSGRAGVQWQPSANTNIYASFNRGYKGGAVDVSRGATAPTATYSPILKPEIATSYEFGIKQTLIDRKLQVNFNLYSQKIKGLQQSLIIEGTTSSQYFNTGAVKSQGFELEIFANISDRFQLNGGLVYTDSKYQGDAFVNCYTGQTGGQGCLYQVGNTLAPSTDANGDGRPDAALFYNLNGLQSRGSQRWRWNTGFSYSPEVIPGISTTLRVDYNFFDKTPQNVGNDPLVLEPSRGMLDAALTISGVSDRWQVQIFGKNLTNEFYYSNRSQTDNTISRSTGWLGRDYKRYGGIRVTVNF